MLLTKAEWESMDRRAVELEILLHNIYKTGRMISHHDYNSIVIGLAIIKGMVRRASERDV